MHGNGKIRRLFEKGILALSGAIISFLSVLTGKVAKRNKLKISIILAAFMFLIVSGQQIIGHIDKRNKKLQDTAFKKSQKLHEQTRTEIVKDIQAKVTVTKTLVEQLNDQLKGKSPAKIGVQVIQDAGTDQLLPKPKKSVRHWPEYAKWLNKWTGKPDISPCLSLTFKAGHNYNLNLLLVYLLQILKQHLIFKVFLVPKNFVSQKKIFLKDFRYRCPGLSTFFFSIRII